MFRSYLGVAALLSLAAVVGCDSSSSGTGGSGGSAGTGGAPGTGGTAGTAGSGGAGGTAGSGGAGGTGGSSACVADPITETISLGCTNSVTADISILDWELAITPCDTVTADTDFDVILDGVAFFAESFLDAAQAVVPGGVKSAALVDLAATVVPRSGATGDPVTLGPVQLPYSCQLDNSMSCDPANSEANGSNPDCVPTGGFNPCFQFVAIPISEDCAGGGECETLGKTSQCEANGFCVTGPLPLELEAQDATYTAGAAGTALFGWDDQNTGATLNGDGTYALPAAVFSDPTAPNGLRVVALLSVALQCTMAVDSGGPDGVGVPDQSSPTPDSALLGITVE